MAVADSESRIDKLKAENEHLRVRLHELKIGAEASSDENQTIINLEKELERYEKEAALKQEKYYNVKIISDIITGWARRVVTKIDENYTDEKAGDTDIVELFAHISDKVVESLAQLQDEPAQKTTLMNDFLTDDFVNKNIRVWPTSGKTMDEGKNEMKSHGSKAHMGDQDEINEELVLNADFREQRDMAKTRKSNWELQQEKKRAKEAKNDAKK